MGWTKHHYDIIEKHEKMLKDKQQGKKIYF